MTDMIHLIVPPIIVVFAVAILMVFLAKNISSNDDGGSFILKKKRKISENRLDFLKNKGKSSKKKEKKVRHENFAETKKINEDDVNVPHFTQNTIFGKSKEKVVSLRKKSMVSDKIENTEGRDPSEISLMKNIEESPQDSKCYEKLGDYYMEHEQFEDARECYKYVLRLDPRHKRAQVAMKNLDRVLE